jgi:hypothetical protein
MLCGKMLMDYSENRKFVIAFYDPLLGIKPGSACSKQGTLKVYWHICLS